MALLSMRVNVRKAELNKLRSLYLSQCQLRTYSTGLALLNSVPFGKFNRAGGRALKRPAREPRPPARRACTPEGT